MPGENETIRDAISDAFEKVEGGGEKTPDVQSPPTSGAPPSPEDAAPSTPIGSTERVRDPETGKFVKAEAEKKAEPVKAEAPPQPTPEQPKQPQFAKEGARAPQSWRPAVREKFATLPPEVQEEAIRIDREVRRTMQEAATVRKEVQQYREVFQPVEGVLRSMNMDPVSFTRDAVQTAQALASGPQPVKAQALARLIQIYGVDIPTLDSVLTSMMQGVQPQVATQQYPLRDPRVDELLSTIEKARQASESSVDAEADLEIEQSGVEEAEFYEDLRMDMADILDLAANRGIAMNLKEAYDRAAALNPDISKVLQQRAEFEAAKTGSTATARARMAASSPRSTPEMPAPTAQPESIRDALYAAWNQHNK